MLPCICQRCKGSGTLEAQLLNHGTKDYDWHIFGCDDCISKGIRVHEPNRVYAGTSYRSERPYGLLTPAAKALRDANKELQHA